MNTDANYQRLCSSKLRKQKNVSANKVHMSLCSFFNSRVLLIVIFCMYVIFILSSLSKLTLKWLRYFQSADRDFLNSISDKHNAI